MFGGASNSSASGSKSESDPRPDGKPSSPESSPDTDAPPLAGNADHGSVSGERRSGRDSPPTRNDSGEKKRRSSGVGSKASSLLASARNSLNFSQITRSSSDSTSQSALQKLGKHDPALAVPQGQHNNSAGESLPGPGSTFRVGVWEDRNRKCRRTMEDTHAFLYNFLDTPAPATESSVTKHKSEKDGAVLSSQQELVESDNGYFAIFDGHAGTFAADWCGKKLHLILEEVIRKNPNSPIPELLDQTFTSVDAQLEKLPLKNSGCTAAVALLRWEDRVPSDRSVTGSVAVAQAAQHALANTNKISKAAQDAPPSPGKEKEGNTDTAQSLPSDAITAKLKGASTRQRVLYTANVGDARIILCRGGKALRLSYDHKGSDENEGKRITGAGGLILNNRVNGVLAVTRALGDTYMKHLVTGHPYTTETVLLPEMDEFIIIACDGLWDVCTDQEAVDLVRDVQNPVAASKLLVDHALNRFSTDNLSCMIVRMDKEGILRSQKGLPVVAGAVDRTYRASEADKLVQDTKQHITDGLTPAVGVSPSNNGAGYDQEGAFVPTILNGAVEEEPGAIGEGDSPEMARMPEMVEINRAREPVIPGTEQQQQQQQE